VLLFESRRQVSFDGFRLLELRFEGRDPARVGTSATRNAAEQLAASRTGRPLRHLRR
jgi:hypothetical protein